MDSVFFSIKDLAPILKLHPKTIHRFIKEGKIKARKIGRSWMVHQDDLKEYVHAELAGGNESQPESEATSLSSRISVSAVVEISGQNAEDASRVSNSILALLNSGHDTVGSPRYDFIYHPETMKARHVLYGSPSFISEVLKSFDVLCSQD